MRLWIKILLLLFVVALLIFSSLYLFLLLKGKPLLIGQLENLTKSKVSIGYFNISPPLTIKIKEINIEGLAKIDSLYISPSILGLVIGSVAFSEVKAIKPEFNFGQPLREAETASVNTAGAGVGSPSVPASGVSPLLSIQRLNLIFKRIIVKDGKLNFVDRKVSENGIRLTVKDINFNLTNFYGFPRSAITNFDLKGKIPWGDGKEEGSIQAEGWINLFKKDMQATLKIENIDGIYLYPYYANWVDLEKARIEKAKLNFTSNIHGLNNDVTAQCRLELADIVRRPLSEGEPTEKASRITDAVLDIFRALNQGKIVLDFTIKTKMDRPEFGLSSIKTAFEDKLAQRKKATAFQTEDVLRLPGSLIQGTFKGATDLTKAMIEGVVSVGKEIKNAVEDTFTKEKKE